MRLPLRSTLAFSILVLLVAPVSAQQYFTATMDGGQVVQPSGSPATGYGCFVLNPDSTLDYLVSYVGLLGNETGAHIHGPAPAGINAGVQFPLVAGNPKVGTVGPLSAAQVNDLVAGLYYVQIHSDMFLGGEIRGQILQSEESCAVPTDETTWGAIKARYE